ncbi:MAG: hypothetical protein WCZ47_03475 [Bacilli bacterium]|jgi:hypothetical protein|nr:hypothetical protein [Bacilli bacterium]
MTKKHYKIFTIITISYAFIIAGIAAGNNIEAHLAKANELDVDYNIVLNASNAPTTLLENSALTIESFTPSRYVAWEYKNVKKATSAHVSLQGHASNYGELSNIEPIQGIGGVSVVVGNDADVELLGAYSLGGSYSSIYVFQTANESYPVTINYPFLKLKSLTATKEAILTSVTITYSCMVHDDLTDYYLDKFKEAGDFENSNVWEMSGTTSLVSLSTDNAYFNDYGLLINGWSGSETSRADLSMEYHLGYLPAGNYTFVMGSNLTHATMDIYINEQHIGAISNEFVEGGGQELVAGVNGGSAIYNGKTLDWSWMRSTHPFTLNTTEDVNVKIEINIGDFYEDGVKTTWGALDGIEIIRGSNYLEPVCLRIPDAAISVNETLTTSTVGATVYNYSYPSITSSDIVFTTSSSNLTIANNVITGKAVSEFNEVLATISYGDGLVATATFNVEVSGMSGAFLTTMNTINAAGNFEASDWSVVTAGWTHLSSTTVSYLSNEQKYKNDYSVRPGGNDGLASGNYSLYYISGLSFKANTTYTISYYYYNTGNLAFAVGVSSTTPTTSTTVMNTTTLSGWSASWQKVSFTYSPGASDLTNRYFFIRMLGSGGTAWGFIDYLQIEAN